MGQPVKLADDLILDARLTAKLTQRSIARQIEFWARLGEALEPLLQGIQALALLRSRSEKPFSASLKAAGSRQGRQQLSSYLQSQPFPHYRPADGRPGFLEKIEADGTRTIGRFVRRQFVRAE
jgi:hypothetical protein